MKKKIFGLALTAASVCGVFALSSCGNSSVEGAGEDLEVLSLDDIKGEKVTVEFWHSFGDAISPALESLVDKFEVEMKEKGFDIDVNLVNKGGGYDGLRSAVNLGTSSNAIPTMILGYPDHFADYIQNDILLPLDDYVYSTDSNIALEGVTKGGTNDFISSYWTENQMTIKGQTKVAGIPFNKSTEIMVYNSTLIDPILDEKGYLTNGKWEKPTWDQVFEVSKYIQDNKSTLSYTYNGASYTVDKDMNYPVFVDSEANFFITTSRQWGGAGKYTKFDTDGVSGIVTAYNNSNKQVHEYFVPKMQSKLFHFPAKENQSYGSKLLQNRKAFISIGSTAGIKNNASKQYYLKATGIPQKSYDSTSTQSVIQQGTNLAILTSNSNNKTRLAAWMLIKYLTSTENTVYFSSETGYLPVRQSARDSQDFKDLIGDENDMFTGEIARAINASIAQTDYYFTDPAFKSSSIVRDNAGTIIQDIYIYNKSYDAALTTFYAELESLKIKTEKE